MILGIGLLMNTDYLWGAHNRAIYKYQLPMGCPRLQHRARYWHLHQTDLQSD